MNGKPAVARTATVDHDLLDQLDAWPESLDDVPAVLVHQILPRPALIHIPGRSVEPIFVSVLLHGDEDVGLKAIQQVLRQYRNSELPRAMSIFIGNVSAAREAVRYLPEQVDYNRVWPGSELPMRQEHRLMRRVTELMTARAVVASVDLHNNSGRNPYYACICSLEPQHLQLAGMFSQRVLYFQRPKGVQTQAFTPLCPSITCECGAIGDAGGVRAAARLLLDMLNLNGASDFRASLPAVHTAELYHTIATWRVKPQATLSFDSRSLCDLFLRPDLDRLNFQLLPAGMELGAITRPMAACIEVCDERGRDVTDQYFETRDDELRLRQSVMPSMLTISTDAIRQDCVGYFMERLR